MNRIRAAVPQPFAIGIKVNAADYVSGSVTEEQALEHIREMASWRMLDFIEISGGDYERPDFGAAASPRQAFFAKFSRLALKALPQGDEMPVIMLTGSLVSVVSFFAELGGFWLKVIKFGSELRKS